MGKRIRREMRESKGKNEMSKGKESRSESRERRKLSETETKREWLRVEAKANVVVLQIQITMPS